MREPFVEFENVSFSYGAQPAIKNASFKIEKGEFVGMIGPNGAGKTTIIKLALGLIRPDSGIIRLFGKDISEFKDWRKIGYVPQKATNFDQNFPASVFEVVSMGRFAKVGLFKGLSKTDYAAIDKALKLAGVSNLRDRRIGDLSGGQQQRVFIARALAAEPEFLILDEPTVGIDSGAQHEFYLLLGKLNRSGITLVLVSHDTGVVAKNASRIACVNVAVTMHDASKGIDKALLCAYGGDYGRVPHHHD